MKKIIVLIACAFLASCDGNEGNTPRSLTLRGTHRLRKMTETSGSSIHNSSAFFLLGGSTQTDLQSGLVISFAWQMNDTSTYQLSTLPIGKIRVKFDEKAAIPTIKFIWRHYRSIDQQEEYEVDVNEMLKHIDFAVLTVRPKDWTTQIQLPLDSKPPQTQ
ncbi:MAG: hypothetical protein JWM92_528 [Candidatus Nomurabacteria bacterium]|nr:hypothetical protein [Candidatus Nomurabacteria bacterium]